MGHFFVALYHDVYPLFWLMKTYGGTKTNNSFDIYEGWQYNRRQYNIALVYARIEPNPLSSTLLKTRPPQDTEIYALIGII